MQKEKKAPVMNYSEEISEKLNHILERNMDAEKNYRFASENTENERLKEFFSERADERYDFQHELKSEIRNFGEVPKKESSFLGDVQRTWMNLKTALSSNKEEALLEEITRGEKAALGEYDDILNSPHLRPGTRRVLVKQKEVIEKILARTKKMEWQT